MSKKRIRIVATDGEDTISIGSVRHDNHIIISEIPPIGESETHHVTYHKNGYMHLTTDTAELGMYYGPPLSEFQGLVSSGLVGVPKQVANRSVRDFKQDRKKFDHVTYLDTRPSEQGVYYTVFLCESGFPVSALLQERKAATGCADLSCNMYTAVEPWVGVLSWPQEQPDPGITAAGAFRPMMKAERERLISHLRRDVGDTCPNGNTVCGGPTGSGELCRDCMNEFTRSTTG